MAVAAAASAATPAFPLWHLPPPELLPPTPTPRASGRPVGGDARCPKQRKRWEDREVRKFAGNNDLSALQSLLLEHRPDIDAADGQGKSALHYAARTGASAAVALLLHARAYRNVIDVWGFTPVDEAEYWSVKAMAVEGDGPLRKGCLESLNFLRLFGGQRGRLAMGSKRKLESLAQSHGIEAPWPADAFET